MINYKIIYIQYFYFIYALPYICGVINKCNKLFFDTI